VLVTAHKPSPLAGEGGPEGRVRGSAASAAHKTLAEAQARSKLLIQRARYMRANPTDAEGKLWHLLRDCRLEHLKWRRQFIVDDRYIVDFVCLSHRLIIEADGGQHADRRQDARRDDWLKAQGFTMLRFWNNDVLTNIAGVADAIMAAAESCGAQTRATPHPSAATGTHQSNTLMGPSRLPPSPARGEGF
jgi:very-short-patch-repair endonuclease